MECMERNTIIYGLDCMEWNVCNGMQCKYGMNWMEYMALNIWTTMYLWNEWTGMYGTEYYNICIEWMEWNVCMQWMEWNDWTEIYGKEFIYEINGM